MHGFADAHPVSGALIARGDRIDAAAHTDQQPGEERDSRCAGADRAERFLAGKLTDHGNIRHVEQHLQQVRAHQRNTENENILPKRTVGHSDRACIFHN